MSTTIPEGVKQPSDHRPAKNEANPAAARDIAFEHDGHHWTIPAAAFEDIEVLELLEDENYVSVVRKILGRQQWDAWKNAHRDDEGRVSVTHAEPFITALFEAADQGNSPASPTS